MKRILLSLLLFTSIFANAQNWKSHPKKPYSSTDSCLVFQDSTKKFYRIKCSEIGAGGSSIDTTKVGRIEQGRGTAPIFMYFNGVAWVRNDTSYVPKNTNILNVNNFFSVGLSGYDNALSMFRNNYTSLVSKNITPLGGQSNVIVSSLDSGYIQLGIVPSNVSYSRLFSIKGTNYTYPTKSFEFTNGLAHYNGDYRTYMIDDETIPDIGKVKQLISDSIGTVQSTTLADGKIWIGDGTNTAFPRTLSGDVTVDNLGVTSYNGIVPVDKGGTGLGEMAQWDFSDGTRKLKGLNVTMQYYSDRAYWGLFYTKWASDSTYFTKYVAPQIDWAKENGCNSIRMIGCVAGIVTGAYTLSQYNAMQTQIIRYLQNKRMYYYPCFGSFGDGLSYAQFTDSTATGYVGRCVSVSLIFSQYTNVIGIDMCNEIFFTTGGFSSAQQISFIGILSRNVRTSYPSIKLTASITSSAEGIVSSFDKGNSNVVSMSTYFDFIDRHIYTTNTYEAVDNLTFYNKAIIYGEYGTTTSLSTRMLTMPPLLAANGVNGGFLFCQNAYDNLSANQFALYDPNYIPLDPLASIYFATLIPNQGYQKKLTKVFLASFYGTNGTALSAYTPDLNTPVTLGAITGSPTLNASNQLSMPLSSNFRVNNFAIGDMVRSQIITLTALSEFRWQFHNSGGQQFACRIVTNSLNTTVTMDIVNAAGTILATSGAITTSYASNYEMWYDGATIRMRNGLTNVGISVAYTATIDRFFLVNNAGGTAVIKQLAVFRP